MKLPVQFCGAFDALHEAATFKAGLDDFGSADYQKGLRELLGALDEDWRGYPEDGRQIAAGVLTDVLVARLLTQEGWKRHPEYRQEKIEKPLIVVGLPRTGTTALHKLLAIDPQFQGVPLWLFHSPMVRPPRETWESNSWYRACVAGLRNRESEGKPAYDTNHDISADTVDECFWGIWQDFNDHVFAGMFQSTTYEAWWWRQSAFGAYHRYADFLRLIGFGDKRSWLLKNPGHLFHMDALFEVFPDACVVQTHRDPAKSIISQAYLTESAQRSILGDKTRPLLTGASECYKWLHGIQRAEQIRRKHEEHYVDVRHQDFLRDPMQEVKKIYRHFGFELSDAVAANMHASIASQNPEQKRGNYNPELVGLREDAVREMFSNYIDRYQLSP